MKFNIVKHSYIWLILSSVLVIASLASVAVFGLKFGIDFTGGSLLELRFEQRPDMGDLRAAFAENGYEDVQTQTSGDADALIRLKDIDEAAHQTLLANLKTKYGQVEELSFDSIGPVVGEELRNKSLTGVAITLILIALYIAWSFRKVSEPVASWKYSVLTILSALHDVILPIGVFAVCGHFFGWEVGTAFIAAILTILGYSINDTIVVVDRTRENLMRRTGQPFEEVVEFSLHQTLWRSLSTTITTLLALVAVYFWGGDTTKLFAMALIVGITSGAYSSIFIASPLLVVWEKWDHRKK